MSLQCDSQLFRWLQSRSLVKQGKRNGNSIQVSEEQSSKLFNGYKIGVFLRGVIKDGQCLKKIQAMKDSQTQAIKLYNWNILTDTLKSTKVSLDTEQRGRIAAGDSFALEAVLKTLAAEYPEQSKTTLQVDIPKLTKASLQSTQNVFQLLVLLISRHFKLSPQHALNLFLDNNKYLSHLLVKGVKGSFDFVQQFLQQLTSQLDFVVSSLFCVDQALNADFLLTALKPCLISHDLGTATSCAAIFLTLTNYYKIYGIPYTSLKKWMQNQGLNTMFFSFKKHPSLATDILSFAYYVLDQDLFQQFKFCDKSLLWGNERERMKFYQLFLTHASTPLLTFFHQSPSASEWNKYLLKAVKKSKDPEDILCLVRVVEIRWQKLTSMLQENEGQICSGFLHLLKTHCNGAMEIVARECQRTAFSLMQVLGQKRSPFAPQIYSILAGVFSAARAEKTQFLIHNFEVNFRSIGSLPGRPLLPALLKHIQSNPSYSLVCFILYLISEGRVEQEDAFELLDAMMGIMLSSVGLGAATIHALFSHNLTDEVYSQYYLQLVRYALCVLYGGKSQRNVIINAVRAIMQSIQCNSSVKQAVRRQILLTYMRCSQEVKVLFQGILKEYQLEGEQLQEELNEMRKETVVEQQISIDVGGKGMEQRQCMEQRQYIDASGLKPSQFAIRDLERVRRRKEEKRKKEEEQQQVRQEKVKRMEKLQKQSCIDEHRYLYAFDECKESVRMKLVDLEEQEERGYVEQVEGVLRRFRKLWKFLFYKYSGRSEEKVHMSQIWKMVRDYGLEGVGKEQCFGVVHLVNERQKRKLDPQTVNYRGFEEVVVQLSIREAERRGYGHLPPGEQIMVVIGQMKAVTIKRNGSVQMYDNPQEAYFEDGQIIRELNKRVGEDQNYVVPNNFKKVKSSSCKFEYEINPMLCRNLGSYQEVYTILDSILWVHLGFHLIAPLSYTVQKWIVKPKLVNEMVREGKGQGARVVERGNHPYVKFSFGIKLGLMESGDENKEIAKEVAYVMNEMLEKVERRKVVNEVGKKRMEEEERRMQEKRNDEVNWKKRAESVKLQVESLREKQREGDRARRKSQFMAKRARKEQETLQLRQKIQEFDQMRVKLALKRDALLLVKKEEEDKVREEKIQYKKGVDEYFRKKKEEIAQKNIAQKVKREEQSQKKENQEKVKEEFKKRVYVNNLRREAELLVKVDERKNRFEDVWREIKQSMSEYRTELKMLFQLLLKQEKSKISMTDTHELGFGTLNTFCLKFKIVPILIEKNVLVSLFQYVNREDRNQRTSKPGINFKKFQEIIFLIAVKSKKTFNKILRKRRQKTRLILAFANNQSQQGNHFQAQQIAQEYPDQFQEEQVERNLSDDYAMDVSGVTVQTVKQMIKFLKLPRSKVGMEDRVKEALQSKLSRPSKQLRESFMATVQ